MIQFIALYTFTILQAIQRYRWSTHFSVQSCTRTSVLSSLVVSWQRIYKSLSLQITHEIFFSHSNSFLAIILQLPIPKTRLNSILRSQVHTPAGWRLETRLFTSLNGLNWNLHYNYFAGTTQKAQPLYCGEGVFTEPLHSNGNYSIVACIFVDAGMCLPSRCLEMNVYSDIIIPAFGRHVTVSSGYNSVYSVESPPTFQRNISSQYSGSKCKPSKTPAYETSGKMDVTCFSETSVVF
jgi:hypothetical protein